MALDLDSLADGPSDEELAALSTADRGNKLDVEVAEAVAAEQAEEVAPVVEPVVEEETPATEDKEPARDEKGKFAIPKERFDEAVGKERSAREAAEARAEEAERKLQEAAATAQTFQNFAQAEEEISVLEKQYTDAMLDGNGVLAADLTGQIRRATMALSEERSQARASVVTANALENDRVDATVARLEADNPVLNPKSELFRPKLVRSILAEQRFLISSEGLAPSVALSRAAKEALEELPVGEAPTGEGLAEVVPEKGRKAAAVAKNIATASKQPANLKEIGLDSDKKGQNSPLPDASKMTQEEFAALPESTKSKMRGDFI